MSMGRVSISISDANSGTEFSSHSSQDETVSGSPETNASTFRFGAGAAGLDGAAIGEFDALVDVAMPANATLSPANQKCYFVTLATFREIKLRMSGLLDVPMLPARLLTVDGETCRVYETEELMTWTNLVFELVKL
jgi:hypothetical protein